MQKVATSNLSKFIDTQSTSIFNIPSIILMENAAIGIYNFINYKLNSTHSIKNILILCGIGNNGGDGYATARHLVNNNYSVDVLICGDTSKLSIDAKINYDILNKLVYTNKKLKLYNLSAFNKIKNNNYDLILDSIFGVGLNSNVEGDILKIVKWTNSLKVIKVAIDIPTGLSANNGIVLGDVIKSDYTLTMAIPKVGMYLNDAPDYCGEIYIIDISAPRSLLNDDKINYNLITSDDVEKSLPKRKNSSHKYSVGKVLIIGGSKGLTGAAKMSAEASLISGCGGTIILAPENLCNLYAKKLKEVMYFSISKESQDFLSIKYYDNIKNKINWADVLLIGPGLGKNIETQKLVENILLNFKSKKKLIDADGLTLIKNLIQKNKSLLTNAILTPHLGEFSKLIDKPINEIKNNFIKYGLEFSDTHKCVLVLKGAPTFIFYKGIVYINSTGNPGMATVGMGDVLSGVISSLLAQGNTSLQAAINGTFLHGLSGDISASKKNMYCLIASDVIKNIPNAYNEILKK